MNLMHLRTFLHMAQLGGFTAAADQLIFQKEWCLGIFSHSKKPCNASCCIAQRVVSP